MIKKYRDLCDGGPLRLAMAPLKGWAIVTIYSTELYTTIPEKLVIV